LDSEEIQRDIVFSQYLRDNELTFNTTWGLFSPKEIDAGSRLLIKYIKIEKDDICLDLGCGYGPIGLTMAKLAPQGKVYMVDKDYVAVEYAKKNVELNGIKNCEVFLSNAFSNVPDDVQFDVIASNLPANVGKKLLRIILSDSKRYLKEGGKFYVVTMSRLRTFIKRNFVEIFGNYKKVKQGKSYTVAMTIKGVKDVVLRSEEGYEIAYQ
jgi:16S rRNA G1207 methylase RsmC